MDYIQLIAGYINEPIYKLLNDKYSSLSEKLLKHLSHFELESQNYIPQINQKYPSILAVANNIISRGLPTRMSFALEKLFCEKFEFLEQYNELGGTYFKLKEGALPNIFWEALHIIDPRISRNNAKIDYEKSFETDLGSDFEENFLLKQIPNILGDHFIQLIESQRHLNELLKVSDNFQNLAQNFQQQRVDFSLKFPYPLETNNLNGFIIEIDGQQHLQPAQQNLDSLRDQAARRCNWEPVRIPTTQWNNIPQKLRPIIDLRNQQYFQIIENNYNKTLNNEWLDVLEFTLAPFAIARIQKTIIELIMRSLLDLNSKVWNICIIERDIPCAYLAIQDFKEFLNNLFELESKNKKLPVISLTVYSTPEFINSKLHNDNIKDHYNTIYDDNIYDVILDISVLQRSRILPQLNFKNTQANYFKIRSVHSVRTIRQVISNDLIEYPEVVQLVNGSYNPIGNHEQILQYFLKNIFRKNSFRLGQLPILSRALSQKNVIGLLPTGGGKSLTYQLACLLQPGLTIIIDPIKSLMQDQVDGLKRNLIDFTGFLNSSKKGKEKEETLKRIANAEALFVFVSPERLQMEEFRKILTSLNNNNHFFSYCVIDEAHCVSEWGHDFRTSYLHLGDNARKYCITKNNKPVTIFGLTATASFDVLADILREISAPNQQFDSDTIVRFETTNRPEIQYEIVNVQIQANGNNIFTIKEQLGVEKQREINSLLQSIPNKLSYYNNPQNSVEIFNEAYKNDPERIKNYVEFNQAKEFSKLSIENFDPDLQSFYNVKCENAGLIFCPHRSWVFGVTDQYIKPQRNAGVYDNIITNQNFNIEKGTFLGVDSEDPNAGDKTNADNIHNQYDFINNKKHLLVATKAFGMGIDKPNIRFSIHLNYPQSIESFVQESGRVGRDGKLALSYILFNNQNFPTNNNTSEEIDKTILEDFHSNSFRGESKEKVIISELLKEISYPNKTNLDLVNDFLEEQDFEASVKYKKYKNNGKEYLFVNQDFGHLSLPNLNSNFNKALNLKEAQEIHQQIKYYISEKKPNNVNIVDWLNEKHSQVPQQGIQQLLELNNEYELDLGFENDWLPIYQEISTFLNNNNIQKTAVEIQNSHTPNGIRKKRKIKFDDFCKELNINLNDNVKLSLEKKFCKFRDKQDTDKAIYRLSTLGIIDEYEVDYGKYTFKLKGKKKTDKEIEDRLIQYLTKYYSQQRVNSEIENIPNIVVQDGNNYLHKCISFLISFIYKEIAKKRKQAIVDMQYACKYLIQSSNIAFKDYIYYYFNSKYARKGYEEEFQGNTVNQSIYDRFYDLNDTPIDNSDSIKIINEFTEYVSSDINNFRHLRGACIRLLQLQPDYFSLHLLKAYAIFAIEQNNPILLEEGIKDFEKGCEQYYETIKLNNITYYKTIDEYITKVKNQTNNQLDKKIENILTILKLKAHNIWLKNTINLLEK